VAKKVDAKAVEKAVPEGVVEPVAAEETVANPQLIHHVIRTISKDNSGEGGSWPLEQIETYLAQWLGTGWRLQSVHVLERLPEGYVVMWALTKN